MMLTPLSKSEKEDLMQQLLACIPRDMRDKVDHRRKQAEQTNNSEANEFSGIVPIIRKLQSRTERDDLTSVMRMAFHHNHMEALRICRSFGLEVGVSGAFATPEPP